MNWRRISYPQIVLAVITLSILLALVAAGSTSSVAFGVYNSGWDGTSQLRAQTAATTDSSGVLLTSTEYASHPGSDTVVFVLAPDSSYSEAEQARVRAFVQRGGTLVVAEDVRTSTNNLLESVGATARVNGTPLRDVQRFRGSPALPVVQTTAQYDGPNRSLALNYPTAVNPGKAQVIAQTSPYAYLDANTNSRLDTDEPLRTHPVATVESVGEGRVYVVGDPSLFLNSMLEKAENRAFVEDIVGEDARAYLDVSRSRAVPPLVKAILWLRRTPLAQVGVGLAILGLVYATMRMPTRGLSQRFRGSQSSVAGVSLTTEEMYELLRAKHPEWDESRLSQIVTSIGEVREQRGTRDHNDGR